MQTAINHFGRLTETCNGDACVPTIVISLHISHAHQPVPTPRQETALRLLLHPPINAVLIDARY